MEAVFLMLTLSLLLRIPFSPNISDIIDVAHLNRLESFEPNTFDKVVGKPRNTVFCGIYLQAHTADIFADSKNSARYKPARRGNPVISNRT
jgi:hypothetical protein